MVYDFLATVQKLTEGKNPKAPGQSEKYGTVFKEYNKDKTMPDYQADVVEIQVKSYVEPYNHWNLSQQARIEALDKQFDGYLQKIKNEMGISEFSDLGHDKNDVVTIVGRLANSEPELHFKDNIEIINYSDDNDGKKRVKLNLDQVKEPYTLFEGQIVVVKGTSDLDSFDATEIQTLPYVKQESPDDVMASGTCTVHVYNGPFTNDDKLDFEHLQNVHAEIKAQRPQVAILTGPFLDCKNELVKEGELLYKNEEGELDCFEDSDIYLAIKNYMKELNKFTKIVMIPGINDTASLHPFPQPPLKTKETENMHFLPNPARFSINGVEFGVLNAELMRPLCFISAISGNPGEHKIKKCTREIIKQRSFFPLYPPRDDTPVDISRFEQSEEQDNTGKNMMQCVGYDMPSCPDVFITTSELPQFVDDIDNKCVYFNPGVVSKRNSYAEVQIDCDSRSQNVSDKIKVQIKCL